jgi:hypothetical protein
MVSYVLTCRKNQKKQRSRLIKGWTQSKANVFLDNINSNKVDDMLREIKNCEEIVKDFINTIFRNIENTLLVSAKKTFGIQKNENKYFRWL